ADAHAAGVEDRVGAAVDDEAAVPGLFAPVAVAPDVRVFLEIGRAVLGAVGIVPEADRHRGERPGADQLAFFTLYRATFLVENRHRHAEALGLDLAAPYRTHRVAEDEARHDVGAAGDRGQAHVVVHVLVDVIEALGCERR